MRKFFTVIKLAIIDSFEYRADILFFTLGEITKPLIFMAIWLAALASGAKTPLSKQEFIQYYLLVLLMSIITSAWSSPFISSRIRHGRISPFLLKPFPYVLYDWGQNIGEKFLKLIYLFPALIVVAILFNLGLPTLTAMQWTVFLISIIFCSLLTYIFDITIGFAAFWLDNTTSLGDLQDLLFYILSGQLFPLILLPIFLQRIAQFSPYRYMLSFPIEIYLHKVAEGDLLGNLALQFVWLVAAVVVCRLVWTSGLKKYSAVGA